MKNLLTVLPVLLALASGCLAVLPLAGQVDEDLPALLSRFQSEDEVASKEAILTEIERRHPDSGFQLLHLAQSATNVDTRWLAIRGLGHLKFEPATRFLIASLMSPDHYVRANAAGALGEIRTKSAEAKLIDLLKREQDGGVIEQTSLALTMIHARAALQVLEARADSANGQTECWLLGAIAQLGN